MIYFMYSVACIQISNILNIYSKTFLCCRVPRSILPGKTLFSPINFRALVISREFFCLKHRLLHKVSSPKYLTDTCGHLWPFTENTCIGIHVFFLSCMLWIFHIIFFSKNSGLVL